jgi:hypothetical protein
MSAAFPSGCFFFLAAASRCIGAAIAGVELPG